MKIPKRIKCLRCEDVLDIDDGKNVKCSCNKIIIVEGYIKGKLGKDYIDVSPVLLNEKVTYGRKN
jgi:hypothetical protein